MRKVATRRKTAVALASAFIPVTAAASMARIAYHTHAEGEH